MSYNDTITAIEINSVYQQILADSYGGIMYNASNKDKYDAKEILSLWDGLSEDEKMEQNGIVKGVFDFLQEI